MSDIRFNQWLHNSGTGGVSQVDGGHVGIGTTNPLIPVGAGVTAILNVGVVTANSYYGSGANLTGIVGGGTSLSFNDNIGAYFGNSQDLKIHHDGNHSYIDDQGTGNLRLRSGTLEILNLAGNKTSAIFSSGGAQTLNFNNNTKFVTTNTGIDVTGSVVADDLVITGPSVVADLKSTNNNYVLGLAGNNASDKVYLGTTSGNDFIIANTSSVTERLRIKSDGKIGIGTDNPGTALEVNNGTGQQQLRVRNHVAAGNFSGNYGSEFRHAYSSANHAMLIHSQETGTARRVLDISNSNGLFATFTDGKLAMGGLTTPSAKLHALDSSSTTTTILKLRNYASGVNTKPRLAFEASTSGNQGANSYIQGLAGTDAAGSNSNNESGLEFIVTYGGSGTERSAMKLDHDGVCTVPRQPKFNIRCNTNNTFGQGGNYNTNYLSPIPTFTPGNRTELTMRAFTVTYPSYAGGNYPKIVVPVDGFYMFGFAGCYFIQNSSDFVGFGFNVNNEGNSNTGSPTYLISAAQSNNNYYDIVHNISGSVGIQLSANDFVVLYQWSSTSGRFDGNVHLYGYLVG